MIFSNMFCVVVWSLCLANISPITAERLCKSRNPLVKDRVCSDSDSCCGEFNVKCCPAGQLPSDNNKPDLDHILKAVEIGQHYRSQDSKPISGYHGGDSQKNFQFTKPFQDDNWYHRFKSYEHTPMKDFQNVNWNSGFKPYEYTPMKDFRGINMNQGIKTFEYTPTQIKAPGKKMSGKAVKWVIGGILGIFALCARCICCIKNNDENDDSNPGNVEEVRTTEPFLPLDNVGPGLPPNVIPLPYYPLNATNG